MTTILFFACSHPTILKTKKFAKILHKMYFQPFDLAPIPENESKVIEIKVEDYKCTFGNHAFLKKPIIRGVVSFVDSLVVVT